MFGFFKINEDSFYKELLSDNIDTDKLKKYIDKGIDFNKNKTREYIQNKYYKFRSC